MTGTTRVRRIAVDGGESGWESEGAFRRRAAFEVTPHEYDQGQRGASIFEPAHEALKVFAARRYLVGMIPATHTVKLLWTLSLVAATLAVSAASAATSATAAQEALPAPPAQATVDGQQLAVRAMPLVASPMDASAVESLLTDVGLLPVAAAQREAFEKALVAAVAGADLAREAFDAGEYTRVVDAIAAVLAKGEYPTTAHVAMTRSLRGNALAIDLTLIDAAARAAAQSFDANAQRQLQWAQLMRRADAAAQTMRHTAALPIPFITVSAAFQAISTLSGKSLDDARAILFLDGASRAPFAEQLSLALLEGVAFVPSRNTHDIQVGLTSALAKGIAVDPEALKMITLALATRAAFSPASELAKLDATLVQSLCVALPLPLAFDVIASLEKSSPNGTRLIGMPIRIAQIAREAIALPAVTKEQVVKLTAATQEWQSSDAENLVTMLNGYADFMNAASALAKSMNPDDPQTWPIGELSPTMKRIQQQLAQRVERLQARRAVAKSTREKFEAILGAELWKAVAPPLPRAPPGTAAGTAAGAAQPATPPPAPPPSQN